MNENINLFSVVSDILAKKGHIKPTKWQDGINVTGISKLPYVSQRKLVNQHLRLVLGACSADTSRERFCLIDDGPLEQWSTLFEREIADTMVLYCL